MRADTAFTSAGLRLAAWLYEPESERPGPLVVMAHGFGATREMRLDAYAERFAAAGLGVLLFDYRNFGASEGEPRQVLEIEQQHADWRAAIAFARGIDWVDPRRVALFGSSYSGGHVIAVAASDPTIAAIVSQCPFTDVIATARTMPPAVLAKLGLAAVRDRLRARTGRPPIYVQVAGVPGSVAMMTTPDALSGYMSLVPEDGRWDNRVAARALAGKPYRPGTRAKDLGCPALFSVCDNDSVTPATATLKLVAAAPRGEIKRYPFGHFEIYTGEAWEQPVSDQTEFLVRHLKP